MMHLYSVLLCIVVHPMRFTIMWGGGGGGSPQPTPVDSHQIKLVNRENVLLVVQLARSTNQIIAILKNNMTTIYNLQRQACSFSYLVIHTNVTHAAHTHILYID